jgi:proline racemase
MKSVFDDRDWRPPADGARIETIDMHTGGEPLRVFTSGLPTIEGSTVLEKRRYFREHYDHIRTGTMWEPRGHADMYGAVVTPSIDADFDVFFLHNEGYSTMCGHAIIALTTLAVETGLAGGRRTSAQIQLTFSVPAGLIEARARVEDGRARDVSFRNVPSFVYSTDQRVDVPGIGQVRFDVAYGGAFYALVEAQPLGLELIPEQFNQLVDHGRRIKHAVVGAFEIEHPFEKELSFLYGTIFTGPAEQAGCHSRNVCIFADGELDRSPTGSGVSARAALHHARGELRMNERVAIESILGTTMTVRAADQAKFGPYDAVIPEVGGTAYITGRNEFYFDPEDPLRRGFILR